MSHRTVVFSLGHVQVGHSGVSLAEAVHGELVPLRSDLHGLLRHKTLLPLIIELAYSGEHLPSEVILILTHLSLHDLLGSFSLLDLSLAEAPIEDRYAEGNAYSFLVEEVLVCLRECRTGLRETKAGIQRERVAS